MYFLFIKWKNKPKAVQDFIRMYKFKFFYSFLLLFYDLWFIMHVGIISGAATVNLQKTFIVVRPASKVLFFIILLF